MKLLHLFLAASITANAAWLVITLRHHTDHNSQSQQQSVQINANATTPTGGAAPTQTTRIDTAQPLAVALNSNDPEALRDALRAAGIDDELVRRLVSMRIWKNYETRFKSLQNQIQTDDSVWWKQSDRSRFGSQSKEQRDELRRLQKEMQEESERLLGPAANQAQNQWLDKRFSFLSPEKRALLQQTEQDYSELMGEINNETQGFQLPSDREQLRFLEEEKRRDLEALLSPEELRAYELRNSQTAQQLRWKMTRMDATEEEYLKIFALQKDYDEIYNPRHNYAEPIERDQVYWKARQEAEKALNAQIQATIGDERYTDYILSNDHGYQQVQAATRRFGLPEDTPRKIYALRSEIPTAANAIADDTSLSYEQKTSQLAALAETARNQIRAQLGSEAAEVILKNGSFRWINQLEKGEIATYDINGSQSMRRLPKPPAVKKP